MISKPHVEMLARYNRWQNTALYQSAQTLSDQQRREDRGAFFGSLHTTLAHVLWADRVWMNRFAGTPETTLEDNQGKGPAYQDWERLQADRHDFDETIQRWASELDEAWLETNLTWWNTKRTQQTTKPVWRLVAHFFNHQTHHRGQAHALLTAFGADTHSTDLLLMPDE